MRTMYDSTAAIDIPSDARMVAGYVDGKYKWSPLDWLRFPHAIRVRIAVFQTTNDGHVLDVESGNADPSQSVDWVLMRRKAGADPTVYCSESLWPSVHYAFQLRKVAEPHYWTANYTRGPTLLPGTIAHQYADPITSGGHYDLSIVADYWPGVDPIPSRKVKRMFAVFEVEAATAPKDKWPGVGTFNGTTWMHIEGTKTEENVASLLKAAGQTAPYPISYSQYLRWTGAL